jgi:hypothetical protein
LHRFAPEDDWTVTFELPYGEWIRLFRADQLVVVDLIEVQPSETATSTYELAPLAWARLWQRRDPVEAPPQQAPLRRSGH